MQSVKDVQTAPSTKLQHIVALTEVGKVRSIGSFLFNFPKNDIEMLCTAYRSVHQRCIDCVVKHYPRYYVSLQNSSSGICSL